MSTTMQVVSPSELAQWKSPGAIKQRVMAIQQLMSEVLKPGTKDNEWSGDYGIIPGAGKKPSLWKSGSEQILAMFEIAVEPIVEDLSTEDCFRYRVTTRLTHAPSGQFLGAGVGEASSDETKYKWRRTYSQKEFDATPSDRRKIKYSQLKDSQGMWADKEELLIRTEPADVANTILKMAKKRSQIDGTLTVTGASSMFDQDLEDLQVDEREEPRKRKAAPTAASVKCTECGAIGGHLPKCSKRKSAEKIEQVMCGDCGKMNGHEPTCKHAPQTSTTKETAKIGGLIISIKQMLKKADKDGKREPYVAMTIVDGANKEHEVFVWHKTPQEFLTESALDKTIMVEVSTGKRTDGSPYSSLEKILELSGVPFVDNKPAQQGEMSSQEETF